MILGIVIVKRKYTLEKYISVLLITAGIIICTLYSSDTEAQVVSKIKCFTTCLICFDNGEMSVTTSLSFIKKIVHSLK